MHKKGQAIIANQNTGKTTYLYEKFIEAYDKNRRIIVLDSATDHKEKSLIEKVKSNIPCDFCLIKSCEKALIEFPKHTEFSYPYGITSNLKEGIFLCDMSLYLENGYNFPIGLSREKERLWYKKLSMQVTWVLMQRVDLILMDEIELVSDSNQVVEKIYRDGLELIVALHELEGLGGLEDMFTITRKTNEVHI